MEKESGGGERVKGRWGSWERGGDRWSEGVRLTRCGDAGVGDEGYRGWGLGCEGEGNEGVRVRWTLRSVVSKPPE